MNFSLLGEKLGLKKDSPLIEDATSMYCRYKNSIGNKFNEHVIQVAILILVATYPKSITNADNDADVNTVWRVDRTIAARVASCSLRDLSEALEMVAAIVGGWVTEQELLHNLGLSSLQPVVTSLREQVQRQGVANVTSPLVLAALIHLAIQAIGSRLKLQVICEMAFSNLKLTTNCRQSLEPLLEDAMQKIKANDELVTRVKEGLGKRPNLRKMEPQAQLDSELVRDNGMGSMEKGIAIPLPVMANVADFIAIHAVHDLGYSFMRTLCKKLGD